MGALVAGAGVGAGLVGLTALAAGGLGAGAFSALAEGAAGAGSEAPWVGPFCAKAGANARAETIHAAQTILPKRMR